MRSTLAVARPAVGGAAAASFAYISLDKTGRYLFGASYHAHLISVNAVGGSDGHVAPRRAGDPGRPQRHSIRADEATASSMCDAGSDLVFQFTFDAKSGLSSNTPAVAQMQAMTWPRHFVTSADNRFLCVLSELLGTVTTFALDGKTGLLTEISSVSGLPPDTKLVPGAPRVAAGAAGAAPPRNRDSDIWAADIYLTPEGRFLHLGAHRQHPGAFSVNARQQATPRAYHRDAARGSPSTRKAGSWSPPGKSRTRFRCMRSTRRRRAIAAAEIPRRKRRQLGRDRRFRVRPHGR
jgi:6-phosphogluconolactonase (cycloisomerase 2 family)